MATVAYAPSATTTPFAEMTAPHRQQMSQLTHQEGRTNLDHINVSDVERWISLVAGPGLAVVGLARGTLGGLGLALVGASLTYRGISGHCHLYGMLGVNTAAPHGPRASIPAGEGEEDLRRFKQTRESGSLAAANR